MMNETKKSRFLLMRLLIIRVDGFNFAYSNDRIIP